VTSESDLVGAGISQLGQITFQVLTLSSHTHTHTHTRTLTHTHTHTHTVQVKRHENIVEFMGAVMYSTNIAPLLVFEEIQGVKHKLVCVYINIYIYIYIYIQIYLNT